MFLYYVHELWMRSMYDKYEHVDPKVVFSVDQVMGLYLHMVKMQPRVTYVIILLYLMMIDICIMTIIPPRIRIRQRMKTLRIAYATHDCHP